MAPRRVKSTTSIAEKRKRAETVGGADTSVTTHSRKISTSKPDPRRARQTSGNRGSAQKGRKGGKGKKKAVESSEEDVEESEEEKVPDQDGGGDGDEDDPPRDGEDDAPEDESEEAELERMQTLMGKLANF